MVKFAVKELEVGSSFSQDMYLDEQFFLLPAGLPVKAEFKRALTELGLIDAYVVGNETSIKITAAADREVQENFDLIPSQALFAGKTGAEQLDLCQKTWERLGEYAHELFLASLDSKTVNVADTTAVMEQIVAYVTANARMVLHVHMDYEGADSESIHIHHAVRCTVYAILVGQNLGLPVDALVELGLAAFLHELGMFFLAGSLYRKEQSYLPLDKKEMHRHPNIGANVLRPAGFSDLVCNAVQQHHERLNGTGYPMGLFDQNISIFGKIIAVVCDYEALSSHRPYHRERRTAHQAIVTLLQESGKLYDGRVVRVLATVVGLYPLGTVVCLNDNRICRVVEVNPKAPRSPILALTDADGKDGPLVIPDGTKIIIDRELTKEEARKRRMLEKQPAPAAARIQGTGLR